MHFRSQPFAAWSRIVAAATVVAAAAVIFAASAVANGSHAKHKSLGTVTISYNPNSANLTTIVAQQQGFFKKNGLNAKLEPSQDTTQLLPDVGKSIDIDNTTSPNMLQGIAHGYKLVLVMSQNIETTKNPDSFLMVGKGITSAKQLKGDTIGVVGLSGTLYSGPVIYLQSHGVKSYQVKFLPVPLPDMAADLQSGTIQAAATIIPFNGQMQGEGFHELVNPTLAAIHSNVAMDLGWVAGSKWAASHKPQLAAFVKSEKQALAWMKAHKSAVPGIIESNFHLPAAVAQNYPWAPFNSLNVKPRYVTDWIKPMQRVGELPKHFKVSIKNLIFKP